MSEPTEQRVVYVVTGGTGEYSDAQDWDVAAFLTREPAEALCKRLNDWCAEHGAAAPPGERRCRFNGDDKPPEDPQFQCDYTGTSYHVGEIPLHDPA